MHDHIAVIDIGKTNAKLVLIDREHGQIATLSRANSVLTDGPYPHYDIETLWQFILDGLTKLHREHRIDAVSITTHGATAALISGNDLAMPVLDYEHTGPNETAAEYDCIRPDFAETLSPRLPIGLNLGAQFHWLEHSFPKTFARTTSILMYPQFWAWKLTGILASEVTSLGTHTDMWAPAKATYSDLVSSQNWAQLLPPIHKAASTLGPITPEIAHRTGLPADTPVATGIHDSNASLLPWLRVLEPPFTVISSGTWTIHMTVGGSLNNLDPARDTLANVDAFARPVPTARFMGGREYEQLTSAQPDQAKLTHIFDNDIMVLPSFTPGIGPFPNHKGRWINEPDGPTDRANAASLYLALMSQACLALCETGNRIIVEGPLAKNGLYCSALTTLTNKPVTPSTDATGTSTGAAMLFDEFRTRPAELASKSPSLNNHALGSYAAKWRAHLSPSSS